MVTFPPDLARQPRRCWSLNQQNQQKERNQHTAWRGIKKWFFDRSHTKSNLKGRRAISFYIASPTAINKQTPNLGVNPPFPAVRALALLRQPNPTPFRFHSDPYTHAACNPNKTQDTVIQIVTLIILKINFVIHFNHWMNTCILKTT